MRPDAADRGALPVDDGRVRRAHDAGGLPATARTGRHGCRLHGQPDDQKRLPRGAARRCARRHHRPRRQGRCNRSGLRSGSRSRARRPGGRAVPADGLSARDGNGDGRAASAIPAPRCDPGSGAAGQPGARWSASQVDYPAVTYVTPSDNSRHQITALNHYTDPATHERCMVSSEVSFTPDGGEGAPVTGRVCESPDGTLREM